MFHEFNKFNNQSQKNAESHMRNQDLQDVNIQQKKNWDYQNVGQDAGDCRLPPKIEQTAVDKKITELSHAVYSIGGELNLLIKRLAPVLQPKPQQIQDGCNGSARPVPSLACPLELCIEPPLESARETLAKIADVMARLCV